MPNKYSGATRVASGDEVDFRLDLSEMFEFIGKGTALSRSMKTKKYASNLFDVAFAEADEEFNVRAAAFASVSGSIGHMYEWGTVGINTARTNMRPNPMSPAARLWTTVGTGSGFDRTLTYFFKPSIAIVPKPTVRDTGMDPNVISKLRDHVFRWKAEIMEWGREVVIAPKNGKALLIPILKTNGNQFSARDRNRGYTFSSEPISFRAGAKKYSNNFTTMFMSYWEGEGEIILNKSIERQFLSDYNFKLTNTKRYKGLVSPSVNKSIKARVEEEAKKYAAEAEAAADTRAGLTKGNL